MGMSKKELDSLVEDEELDVAKKLRKGGKALDTYREAVVEALGLEDEDEDETKRKRKAGTLTKR